MSLSGWKRKNGTTHATAIRLAKAEKKSWEAAAAQPSMRSVRPETRQTVATFGGKQAAVEASTKNPPIPPPEVVSSSIL